MARDAGGAPAMSAHPSISPAALHLDCPFTGRHVCRCICGSTTVALTGFEPSAAEHMQRARAAWRHAHHPNPGGGTLVGSGGPADDVPAVIMLPKLVRHVASKSSDQLSAAQAAAAVRVGQAEAAAQAAVLRAASLAAAAGLPYRPPGGVALDISGIAMTDHSELERQVEAVRRAQESRQAAAAAAAAAAAQAAVLPVAAPQLVTTGSLPLVVPLAALGPGGEPSSGQAGTEPLAVDVGGGGLPFPADSRPPLAGQTARRTRSADGSAAASGLPATQSLPLPSISSAGGGRARRSPAGKPPAKPALRLGPGKGVRRKATTSRQAAGSQQRGRQSPASADRHPGTSGGGGSARAESSPPLEDGVDGMAAAPASAPDLSPFGDGYTARGPSTAMPPQSWLLRIRDFKPALKGRLVQTYWADGGHWWPAVVLAVSVADRSCSLYYETGDEETVEFTHLIQSGEVAWLLGPQSAPAANTDASSTRGRQQQQSPQPPAGQERSPMHTPSQSNPSSDQQQPLSGDGGPITSSERGRRPRSATGGRSTAAASPASALEVRTVPAPLSALTSSGGTAGCVMSWPVGEPSSSMLLPSPKQMAPDGGPPAAAGDGSGDSDLPLLPVGGPLLGLSSFRGSEQLLVDTSEVPALAPSPLPSVAPLGPALQQEQPKQQQQQQQQQAVPEEVQGQGELLASVEQQPPAEQQQLPPQQRQQPQQQQLPPQQPQQQLADALAPASIQKQQPPAGQPSAAALAALQQAPPAAAPQLAAAAALLPHGFRLVSVSELLGYGEQALGARLCISTLTSGSWQPVVLRQCSARHGLLQVQYNEQQAALLAAHEEGKQFLLCMPL